MLDFLQSQICHLLVGVNFVYVFLSCRNSFLEVHSIGSVSAILRKLARTAHVNASFPALLSGRHMAPRQDSSQAAFAKHPLKHIRFSRFSKPSLARELPAAQTVSIHPLKLNP